MPQASRLLVEHVEDVAVVTFTESSIVNTQQIDSIREELFHMVDKKACRRMILDMTKVRQLSSAALGVLIPVNENIKKIKGKLVLTGAQPEVRKIFKITRLEKLFVFKDDEAAALKHMKVTRS
jgi:anti-sigma B factor antagonist